MAPLCLPSLQLDQGNLGDQWVQEDRWGLVQAVTWEATTDLWVDLEVRWEWDPVDTWGDKE